MGLNGITIKLKTMKKYVLKDTNEVVDFGDIIELVLIKNNPDGTDKHKVKMVKFSEDLIPLLLEEGILDVLQDDENPQEKLKKEPLIDFSKNDDLEEKETENSKSKDDEDEDDNFDVGEFIDSLIDVLETLGKSVKALDKEVYLLKKKVSNLEKNSSNETYKHVRPVCIKDFPEDIESECIKSFNKFLEGFDTL